MKKYTVMTRMELAEKLAAWLEQNWRREPFPRVDFAILDGEGDSFTEEEIEDIKWNVSGWYGIKKAPDLGFDSTELILIADYYGGGCLNICQFYDGIDGYLLVQDLKTLIGNTLNVQETCPPETKLFVEWNENGV